MPLVVKTDAEWKDGFSRTSFEVTRHTAPERTFTGQYWDYYDKGFCRRITWFSSKAKFESDTGWPSFWVPIANDNVLEISDHTLGWARTEVECRLRGSYLGRVFDDEPKTTGLRYRINEVSLRFVKST